MADGSVRANLTARAAAAQGAEPAEMRDDFVHRAGIAMKDDFYIEFGIPRLCVGADTMQAYAKQMAGWARATLHVVRLRGDCDDDAPGTLDDALAATEFLLQLSMGLEDAAAMLRSEKGGKGHG